MVASPQPRPTDGTRLDELELQVRNLIRKSLYSASIGAGGIDIDGTGGISVHNGVGDQFLVGGHTTASPHADGSAQIVTIIGDEMGVDRLVLWDPGNPSDPSKQQLYMYDSFGFPTQTQDINGGWATPWFNVPMYPLFTPPQAAGGVGTVYDYAVIGTTAPGIVQGQVLWEGRLAAVSHPRLSVDGTWGQAAGTVVPTYHVAVNGVAVGSFTPPFSTGPQGPWDITGFAGELQVPVTVSVTWTGSGTIAAGLVGCYLRQT